MPLTKCPDCDRELSTAAPSCPHCGRPFGRRPLGVFRILLGVVLLGLSACNGVSMLTDASETSRVGAGVIASVFLALGIAAFVAGRSGGK